MGGRGYPEKNLVSHVHNVNFFLKEIKKGPEIIAQRFLIIILSEVDEERERSL